MRSFDKFLADQGFDPDATRAHEHPDFFALAERMHEALEEIAHQGATLDEQPKLPTAYLKGHRARKALGLAS